MGVLNAPLIYNAIFRAPSSPPSPASLRLIKEKEEKMLFYFIKINLFFIYKKNKNIKYRTKTRRQTPIFDIKNAKKKFTKNISHGLLDIFISFII